MKVIFTRNAIDNTVLLSYAKDAVSVPSGGYSLPLTSTEFESVSPPEWAAARVWDADDTQPRLPTTSEETAADRTNALVRVAVGADNEFYTSLFLNPQELVGRTATVAHKLAEGETPTTAELDDLALGRDADTWMQAKKEEIATADAADLEDITWKSPIPGHPELEPPGV